MLSTKDIQKLSGQGHFKNEAIEYIETTLRDFGITNPLVYNYEDENLSQNERDIIYVGDFMTFGHERRSKIEYILSNPTKNIKPQGFFVGVFATSILDSSFFNNTRANILSKYCIRSIIQLERSFRNTGLSICLLVIKDKSPEDNEVNFILHDFSGVNHTTSKLKFTRQQINLSYKNWSVNFNNPAFEKLESKLKKRGFDELKNMDCEIIGGRFFDKVENGDYYILSPRHLVDHNFLNIDSSTKTTSSEFIDTTSESTKERIVQPGDILINIHPPLKFHFVKEKVQAVASQSLIIIRGNFTSYLGAFLKSNDGFLSFKEQVNKYYRGSAMKFISPKTLGQILVPTLFYDAINEYSPRDFRNYEIAITKNLIAKGLIHTGWDAIDEFSASPHHRLDIALLIDGELVSFIEIKIGNIRETKAIEQTVSLLNKFSLDGAFLMINDQLKFVSKDGIISEVGEIPSPETFQALVKLSDSKSNNQLPIYQELGKENLLMMKLLIKNTIREEFLESKEVLHRIERGVQTTNDGIQELRIRFDSISKQISKIQESVEELDDRVDQIFNVLEKEIETLLESKKFSLAQYKRKVTEWFDYWIALEEASKDIMPGAEYLLEKIDETDIDYSPFIIYYCKALELELLEKIFRNWRKYFRDNPPQFDISKWDSKGLSVKKENDYALTNLKLVGFLNQDKKLTLGDMRMILSFVFDNSNRVVRIPSLKLFQEFLQTSTLSIKKEDLEIIKKIVDYRNAAAHIELIKKEHGHSFYTSFKILMNNLFNSLEQ